MSKEDAYKSLLDCWIPPETNKDGDVDANVIPIAFISTSFTFDSEFFEDECLTRFLAMETERENDGVAYLIEREEKLAGLHGGIVMIDQDNCKGGRTIRWDLVSCRVPNGVMHAKITLLHWNNCIRVVIGSANLTQSGCCINQEIFGVIDYLPEGDADLKLMNDVLDYLQMMIMEHAGDVVKSHFAKIKAEIKTVLKKWNITDRQYKRDEVSVHALFVSPKDKDALTRLRNLWDSYTSSPPNDAYITSPFFDSEENSFTPSIKIFDILKQRGEVHIQYNVVTEQISENSKELLVHAPEFLKNIPVTSSPHFLHFNRVSEEGINEDDKKVPRPLHLKSIWLCNEDMHLYQIGSSNFTSPGLGLSKRINYEANLVYCISAGRNNKAYKTLEERFLEEDELDLGLLKFKQRVNDDELSDESEYLHLPLFFGEAVLLKHEDQYILELSFNSSKFTEGFEIHKPAVKGKDSSGSCIYNHAQWKLDSEKSKVAIDWIENSPPDYLLVSWVGSNGNAFWPVVVDSQIILPPVEALRDLPLEALLQILSSTQPLHRLLKIIEKAKNKKKEKADENSIVDALRLVDSSGFLLQRTRRVSYAMRALRERLQRPVYTTESLNWRLYGPIGVNSLKEAILKEARSEEEKKFLLAELALELSRVQPTETNFSIKAKEIKVAVKKILEELSIDFSNSIDLDKTAITNYSNQAVKKALNEL